MDGSWSIGKRRFKIQKDFLADVAQAINVGVAGPMMGIIQYGYVKPPPPLFPSHSQSSVNGLRFIGGGQPTVTVPRPTGTTQ